MSLGRLRRATPYCFNKVPVRLRRGVVYLLNYVIRGNANDGKIGIKAAESGEHAELLLAQMFHFRLTVKKGRGWDEKYCDGTDFHIQGENGWRVH